VSNFFQNNYPHLNNTHTKTILEAYPEESALAVHAAYFPSAATAYGDTTFICPALQILRSAYAANNTRAWGYRYNVLDPINAAEGLGVPHTWETWAVFGPDSLNGIGGGPTSYYTTDAAIVPIVMDYWISFVRTLDPNVLRNALAPTWEPAFAVASGTQQRLMFETGNVTMEDVDDIQQARCDMWWELAVVMEQ
jgi:acetylcholinesterase